MFDASSTAPEVTLIRPRRGWQMIDFRALKGHRDLLLFLVWRDIRVLYAQTILGFAWAILQPLIQIAIFTVVFGRVAKVGSDGIPYLLFTSVAIIPWTYLSQSITQSSESLVKDQNMLGKIYFPRLIFPLTPVLAKTVDFAISISILLAVGLYYRVMPTWNLLYFPLLVLAMMALSAGVGFWLSAMAIRYRDVKHAMPFAIRMLVYSAPIVYSASAIPADYRLVYSLNPLVAIIEGFRSCLLGTPMPWLYVLPGLFVILLLLVTGALYFQRMERVFVDVI